MAQSCRNNIHKIFPVDFIQVILYCFRLISVNKCCAVQRGKTFIFILEQPQPHHSLFLIKLARNNFHILRFRNLFSDKIVFEPLQISQINLSVIQSIQCIPTEKLVTYKIFPLKQHFGCILFEVPLTNKQIVYFIHIVNFFNKHIAVFIFILVFCIMKIQILTVIAFDDLFIQFSRTRILPIDILNLKIKHANVFERIHQFL